MTEPNMTKLAPCPRCKSPFVETQEVGVNLTVFACAVCSLSVRAQIAHADAVRMWNEWERRDSMLEAAEGTASMARAHALDTAAKPTRLERIVTAQLATGRWPGLGKPPGTVEEIASGIVRYARAIELALDEARA